MHIAPLGLFKTIKQNLSTDYMYVSNDTLPSSALYASFHLQISRLLTYLQYFLASTRLASSSH